MQLPLGKIPIDVLKEIVFKNLGAKRKEIMVGPSAGIDGAVLDLGDNALVVSMDPITGAVERIGWLAVNINANDVATFGVNPAFFSSCIMLPEYSGKKLVEDISKQIDSATKELGIAVVGGHCELTPSLTQPIVVGCAMGLTKKKLFVTAGGAKQGDKLILTKSAGIEGTAILATEYEQLLKKNLSLAILETAKNFYSQISVVKDALTSYKTGGVHAMHDPTEGGIIGGIHEIADASNLGVKVFEKKILISNETAAICGFFGIDPLQLIGSGALLISADEKFANEIIQSLKQQEVYATIIGEMIENVNERTFLGKCGKKDLPRPVSDHLWKVIKQKND